MSFSLIKWAWTIELPPLQKLVLLKLADHCNEDETCYPSIATLAKNCSASERSIQRAIRDLSDRRLISVERRHRGDGSQRSNQYRLISNVTHGVAMTPSPDIDRSPDRQVQLESSPPGDTPVTQTIREPKPSNPPPHSSGDFPHELSNEERHFAVEAISGLDVPLGQQVLDEWIARLSRGTVKNPQSYLRHLVQAAKVGNFVPELALTVQKRRDAETKYGLLLAADRHYAQSNRGDAVLVSLPDSLQKPLMKIKNGIDRRRGAK